MPIDLSGKLQVKFDTHHCDLSPEEIAKFQDGPAAVGRWVERDPATDAAIGTRFTIADVVEEVFLTAFETYDDRPQGLRFGDWLDSLIDPAVKELLRHPEELESVSLARTLQGVAPTR